MNDKSVNIIDLGHSKISLREDGIVEVEFEKNLLLDIKECEDIMNAYDQILESKKYPILHVAGKYMNATSAARDFGSSEKGLKYSKAEAYVIHSLAQKIVANFYMKFNKPSIPTQFFQTKEEAVNWLLTFV